MSAYEPGSSYRSAITVTDSSGTPVDATAVLTITLPDQTVATPSVTHDSTGNYHVDYVFTMEGLYVFHWVTTGPNTTKTDYVPVNVHRSVISLDDAKNFVAFDSTGGKEDILRQIMAAATELIEDIAGICVVRTFTDQRITGSTAQVIKLPHSPLPNDTSVTSISSVFNGGPVWTQAGNDFIVFPNSGTVQLTSLMPFYFGPWKATYQAGRSIIPQKIQLAAKEIIYDLWATQRQFGMDQLEPSPEDTARWEQMLVTYKIPPHAMAMLNAEERPGFR
jgi:hypothetical protein